MQLKNQVLYRTDKKPIVWDAVFNDDSTLKPLVIFCHGYKGFKDWGSWDLVAQQFCDAGFFFVKFNFSHNGGTIDNPIDFPDLDAFAENNYSKELDDLEAILNLFSSENFEYHNHINTKSIAVIGHSRGGGISIIKTSEDKRITRLVTWASVSGFGKRTSTTGDLKQWKKDGVKYVLNGRTKQQMPHNYQFYEDYIANEKRFDITSAMKRIKVPILIIHATDDPSVNFHEALTLKTCKPESELVEIENSNHVFGARHPWNEIQLPKALQYVVEKSIEFLQNINA